MRYRLISCAGGGLWWSVAALLLCAAPVVRAEVPENPLRPPVNVRITDLEPDCGELDSGETVPSIWDEPQGALDRTSLDHSTLARAISADEELPPPVPTTIVPRNFGQSPPPYDAEHGLGEAGHDSWVQPWFTHTDPNDPYRHVGVGRPLIGTSWLNRPWYVGVFLGGLLADDLISDHVETNNSFFLGSRAGWDFDHYWGLEGRYAFSRPQINDASGDTLRDPAREYFIDVSLAYYPWGDSQWRPFASIGLGLQTFRFHDDADERIHESLLSMPLGVGLKFFHSPYHTLRLEVYDNIAFGDGKLGTMQNVTLAAGVEFRFGGRPTSYFPWHGSTSYW